MELIAHRGFATEAPENTVPAVRRAAARADAVEIDVRACASGEPVVIHDETVDRVTDATGRVDAFSAGELADLRVQGAAAGVPRLSEVVAAVPADTRLFVEVKERGIADAVAAALADAANPVLLASFDPDTVQELQRAAPDAPTAIIAGRARDRPIATATALDCEAVLVWSGLAVLPRIRRGATAADLECYAWTIERPIAARILRWLGVDGVIADRSDVLGARQR